MKRKRDRTLCLVLAFFSFLSWMWFESIKVDTMAMHVSMEKIGSNAIFCYASAMNEDMCTTEMLGLQSSTDIQQMTHFSSNQLNDIQVLFDLPFLDIYSLTKGKYFGRTEELYLQNQNKSERVLNYIHRSDGKKQTNRWLEVLT